MRYVIEKKVWVADYFFPHSSAKSGQNSANNYSLEIQLLVDLKGFLFLTLQSDYLDSSLFFSARADAHS